MLKTFHWKGCTMKKTFRFHPTGGEKGWYWRPWMQARDWCIPLSLWLVLPRCVFVCVCAFACTHQVILRSVSIAPEVQLLMWIREERRCNDRVLCILWIYWILCALKAEKILVLEPDDNISVAGAWGNFGTVLYFLSILCLCSVFIITSSCL